ncbi:MAG: hypothetical protein ACKVS9_09655 [Phycisphaerae bacterium]
MVRLGIIGAELLIASCGPWPTDTGSSVMTAASPPAAPSPAAASPDHAGAIAQAMRNRQEQECLSEFAALNQGPPMSPPILVDRSFQPPQEPITVAAEVVITTPYYRLVASPANKLDALLLAGTLDAGIARLVADYAAADADKLLRAATVEVRIAPAPTERADIGKATNMSSWNEGKCTATVHLLAPSAHPDLAAPGAARTNSGEPMDAAYCQRVLMHEYSTVLLESITRSKPNGWSFWNAPSWFVQGSEEYLGVMYSTPHAREVTLPAYTRITREGELVTNDFGIDVQSPYVAGPVLIAFIHERFGREAFIALLRSEAPSFGKAIRRTLNTTPDEFYAAWQAWLADKAGK